MRRVREVAKTVFYCDHCRKHGLSRAAMEKHEAGCTMNPVRVCRWRIPQHSDGTKQMDMRPLAEVLAARANGTADSRTVLSQDDIDWLHDAVLGCPACMLAALRQSGVTDFHHDADSNAIFDYAAEVERLRVEERAEAEADVW